MEFITSDKLCRVSPINIFPFNLESHLQHEYSCILSIKCLGNIVWWMNPDRTTIVRQPLSQTVNISMTVTLVCLASTDHRERSTMVMSWFKDGQTVSRNRDFRFRVSGEGKTDSDMMETLAKSVQSMGGVGDFVFGDVSTLTIRDAHIHDTGNYTCRANNQIDSASASAILVVKGTPVGVLCCVRFPFPPMLKILPENWESINSKIPANNPVYV